MTEVTTIGLDLAKSVFQRAFSDSGQRRRRATPEITSTRRNVSISIVQLRCKPAIGPPSRKAPIIRPRRSLARWGRHDAYRC
jgi:hypothetical protein